MQILNHKCIENRCVELSDETSIVEEFLRGISEQ